MSVINMREAISALMWRAFSVLVMLRGHAGARRRAAAQREASAATGIARCAQSWPVCLNARAIRPTSRTHPGSPARRRPISSSDSGAGLSVMRSRPRSRGAGVHAACGSQPTPLLARAADGQKMPSDGDAKPFPHVAVCFATVSR
jgi:hypothetical protein